MMSSMLGNFEKHPDVAKAAHVGEPTLVDPEPVTPLGVVRELSTAMSGGNSANTKLKVETLNGAVPPSQEVPRSDAQASDTGTAPPQQQPAEPVPVQLNAAAVELKPNVPDANELKPNVAADPNALPPPTQANEIQAANSSSSTVSSSSKSSKDDLVDISSSKKKKKKGLGKLNPF